MKKVVVFLIMVCAMLAYRGVNASAETIDPAPRPVEGEYVISNIDGGYLLSSSVGEVAYISLGECLSSVFSPSSIRFDGVTSDENVFLPIGEYSISGELYSYGVISIPSGANVTAKGLTLTLTDTAYIRIKGGALSVESSSILGTGQLIRLDYSASSFLEIISGVISGESEAPLIDVENGRAVIRGADIENKNGAAIRSDSELCIVGSPKISGSAYGIILEAPMYMGAYDEEYYSKSPLSIQYVDTFSVGTLTEVFYEVTERSLSNITLYDKNGKEEAITHFEKSTHTSEINFAGVYLPHTVKFYIGANLVAEQKLLSGERIIPVVADSIDGYEFDNWYRDREGQDVYTSEKRVYSSFSLYGVYTLNAPTFSISSMDFTYDGNDHTLAFDLLSHPLEGGYYTYTWYKGEDKISDLSRITVRDVSDSGIYSCRVTYNVNGDSASFFAENIRININKRLVSIPTAPAVKYNGLPQYPSLPISELYTASITSGTNAGKYPLTVVLTDTENYAWDGIHGAVAEVEFEILKADNSWVSSPSASDSYIGFPTNISAVPLFGDVTLLYSATENGIYTTAAPTSIGSYYVKASVIETDNFTALTSYPIPFKILSEEVVGLKLIASPTKVEYLAFDKFDPAGMEVAAVYNSGRREVLSSSRLEIMYNDGKSIRAGDTSVVVEYLGSSIPISITVSPLTYDLSPLNFENQSVTFDGVYHTLSYTTNYVIGLDGIALTYEITGGGTDVGEYPITIKFNSESKDYIIPPITTATLTITPITVDLLWSSMQFVYDSTPKLPTATFIDVRGVRRDVTVCGSAILAGEGYIATATSYSSNYIFSNPICLFSISKADYDMTSVFWTSTELKYSGDYLEVILQNLPLGVSVIGYTDNRAQNVGKYIATAALKYDERNYNPPSAPLCEWEIKPSEYDMSSFVVSDAEYEYDGVEHFPIISGSLPIGADGTSPSYTFSRGAINVLDGEVIVTVVFSSKSQNYTTPKSVTAKVKINPSAIYVTWDATTFVYDGSVKSPKADSPLAKIKVSGQKVNAGCYTAVAESTDPNYTVINSSLSYEIKKAENRWINNPYISDFYESGSPDPSATPYFGKAEFRFFSDESLSEAVSPNAQGEYFMVATVPESENYLPLISSPISFKCIEVIAASMQVEITGELVAFSDIKSSLSVSLIYNDGSIVPIPGDSVAVRYQNGDSLLCKDTQCEISYGDFTESVSVKVNPATYDMSSVNWVNTEIYYDGNSHAPYIEGLPLGISILGYIGESGVSAGEYPFSVIFSYDEENYLLPEIPDCAMVIKKAVVPIVSDVTIEYSGQVVDINSSILYTAIGECDIIDSGEYTITYCLIDKDNYTFENGRDECVVKVIVLPRQIRVIVSDVKVYLFDDDPEYSSTVEGEVLEGESLDISYYIDGDKVYAKTNNKNYLLIVMSGSVERMPYPNEETRGKILVAFIFSLAIISIIAVIFKKRDDILDSIYMFKAKIKHKNGTGYINNAPNAPSSITKVNSAPITINLKSGLQEKNTQLVSIDSSAGTIVLSAPKASIASEIAHPVRLIISGEVKEEPISDIAIATDVNSNGDINDSVDIMTSNESSGTVECNIAENDTEVELADKAEDVLADEHNDYYPSASMNVKEKGKEDESQVIESDTPSSKEEKTLEDFHNQEDAEGENTCKADEISILDDESIIIKEPRIEVKMEYAKSAVTDSLARRLIKDEGEIVYTDGNVKSVINVDTLSRNFVDDDHIDVNILKKKSLIPYDTNYIKVLARGAIDKPLKVRANEFSLSAVKMILLSGGEAIRVISEKEEKNKTKK